MCNDSQDRPTHSSGEKAPEIVVTQEMIEAGSLVLLERVGLGGELLVSSECEAKTIVQEVLLAAAQIRTGEKYRYGLISLGTAL